MALMGADVMSRMTLRPRIMASVIMLVLSTLAIAQAPCGPALETKCSSSMKRTSVTPTGTIDGINQLFLIQDLPGDANNIQVFINGVELIQGAGFRISGQTITLPKQLAPRKGDLLRVNYFTADTQTEQQTRSIGGNNSHNAMLADAALLRAVSGSLTNVLSPYSQVAKPSTEIREIHSPQAAKARKIGRSLSMLATQINQGTQAERRSHVKERGSSEQPEGFDGVGDTVLVSPYSALLGLQPTYNLLNGDTPKPSSRGLSTHKDLRSLSLLRDKLDETQKQ